MQQHEPFDGQQVGADTPQVSIIVPFYNVVTFLSRCVDSLVAQTLPVEIILVDDGSTDASGAIADWYASQHAFVRVVHQPNRGQGSARNAGLAASRSPFVSFVDSDDYVDPDYAEKLLAAIRRTRADIAVCGYTTITRHGFRWRAVSHRLLPPALTGAKALRLSIRDISIKSYTWNKLYRRTLFTDRNIAFPDIMFEDMATMPRLFTRARRVATVRRSLYTYCRRSGSLMRTFTPKRIEDNITALAMVRDYLIHTELFEAYRGSYTFLVGKFALSMMLDTLHMYLRHRLGNPFPAAWNAFRHGLRLSKPAADPLATIEALARRGMYQATPK